MADLLTAEQAAARLGMCERTLRKLRQRGEIAYIALTDRKFAYTEADCEDFLSARRRKDEPCPSPSHLRGRRISSMTSRSKVRDFMDLPGVRPSGTRKRTSTTSGAKSC
jgi:hypothetical protein